MLTYEQRAAAKIGCDIDGTLLDYGHRQGEPHLLNTALCEQLRGNNIHLITNQGGLPFGAVGIDGYPTPMQFLERLAFLVTGLAQYQIQIASLRVCVSHLKATEEGIDHAKRVLEQALRWQRDPYPFLSVVYDAEYWHKPNPTMLRLAGVETYYGDSDEDMQAAENAGAVGVRVERFMKREEESHVANY